MMTVKRTTAVAMIACAVAVGGCIGWILRGDLEFDRCLDRGGRWNEYRFCESDG
jgi:hypothetical protein